MQSITVKEILAMDAGDSIGRMQGTLIKVWERKTGKSKKTGKPWSVQGGVFKDESGEIKISVWNTGDVQPMTNKQVVVSNAVADDNEYPKDSGKITRQVKLDEEGDIRLAGASPAVARACIESVDPGDGYQEFRHSLMRVLNAFYKIEEAVAKESEQSKNNGFTSTDAHMQAKCATAFIHLDRSGLVEKLPDKPIWKTQELKPAPPPPAEDAEIPF